MKHLTDETKRRRSFWLNLSSVQTPVPNTADLALLGMTASTNTQCRFLASNTTLQSQTSYFSQSSMRNTHTAGANPAKLQLFWSRRYMWHELYQHKLIFLCSKQRHVCCWDWTCEWTAVDSTVPLSTQTLETSEHLKISKQCFFRYTGAVHLGHRCVCAVRETHEGQWVICLGISAYFFRYLFFWHLCNL